jgi:hypothetical protein
LNRFKEYLDESINYCIVELRDFDWREYINQTPGFLGAARLPLTELDPDRINSNYHPRTIVTVDGEENQPETNLVSVDPELEPGAELYYGEMVEP